MPGQFRPPILVPNHRATVPPGLTIGRHRVARLMRDNGLRPNQKRRFKKTTDSHHGGPIAPNILDQDFAARGPDQKWGVDISYVWTAEGWLYLAIVLDLFSRRIIGWAVSDRLKKDLALTALQRAIALRAPPAGAGDCRSRRCSGRSAGLPATVSGTRCARRVQFSVS